MLASAEPDLESQFAEVFGAAPTVVARAPGRINLIGEHVDYLDGLVLPMAIDRHITVAAAPSGKQEMRIWSEVGGGEPHVVDLSSLEARDGEGAWLNYIIGVVALMIRGGVEVDGFDMAIGSRLPLGAGLSSSAALETATAIAVEAMSGVEFDPADRARLCQRAEHEFAGVPCGIMDQMAVGLGEEGCALLLDCRDQSIEQVALPDGLALVVADTQVKHALADGEYRSRREDCEAALGLLEIDSFRDVRLEQIEAGRDVLDDRLFRRARHVLSEMERVEAFRTALEIEDLVSLGGQMLGSHESLRDDFEVSCAELDCLVEAAYAFGSGHIGSRMTGGGFGGSAISLVRAAAAEALIAHLQREFAANFGRDIDPFVTRASNGAQLLQRSAK